MAIAKPSLALAVTIFLKIAHAAPTTDGTNTGDPLVAGDTHSIEEGNEYEIKILPILTKNDDCKIKFDECHFDYAYDIGEDVDDSNLDFDWDCCGGWDIYTGNGLSYTEGCDEYIEVKTKTVTVKEETKRIYRNCGHKIEEFIPGLDVEEDGIPPYIFWEEKTYILPYDTCAEPAIDPSPEYYEYLKCPSEPALPPGSATTVVPATPVVPPAPAVPVPPVKPQLSDCDESYAYTEYFYVAQ